MPRLVAAALAAAAAATSASAVPTTIPVLLPAELAGAGLTLNAARQLRRFLHVLGHNGQPGPIVAAARPEHVAHAGAAANASSPVGAAVVVTPLSHAAALLPSLADECLPTPSPAEGAYALCRSADGSLTTVVGADERGVFYGVQTLLEHLGVRFTLDSPAVPTPALARARGYGLVPGFAAQDSPVFSLRGLQPFHDFDSGPDWWSEDEQKRVLELIAQMKGNTLAYHTYPIAPGSQGTGSNEPAVWIGLKEDVNPDGTVKAAYPTSWASTLRPEWGMTAINTSDYMAGADTLFPFDCFGHPAQSGDPTLCPWPVDANSSIELFNRVGALWQTSFAYAHQLGVKTILGTETPLSPPPISPDVLTPLNVFYSTTRDDHFVTTTLCDECEGLYDLVGVDGYIYSGPVAGSIGLSTYYNPTITDNILLPDGVSPPAGYSLVRVEGYALAATAPGTVPLQQFLDTAPKPDHWAVAGSGMVANATAAGYKDTGAVLAYIWTTGPPAPTAQDYYEGTFTRLQALLGDLLDYYWIWTPEQWEWNRVDMNNSVVQDVVKDASALQAAHDAVGASFALATCGWVIGPLGDRSYFDTVLPPGWIMGSIDMDVGNTPVDGNYSLITNHQKMVIPWLEDDPGLTAPELWVNRTLEHCVEAVSYNVSNLLTIHWRTRAVSPQASVALQFSWNASLQSADFWADWALAQFGPTAGAAAAPILVSIDSFNLPRPVNWVTGPGTMTPSAGMCSWPSTYGWVEVFASLRPWVVADIGQGLADLNSLERFDYWATSFLYQRDIARMECDWDAYNSVIASIKAITDPAQRQLAARTVGLAARISLVENVTEMVWDHLSRVSSLGDLGTTTNFLSQSLPNAVGDGPTAALVALMGENLPANAFPPTFFDASRSPFLRVLVPRSMLAANEPFRLEAIVLAHPSMAPSTVTLYTAPLGSSTYTPTPMVQVPGDGHVRQVYTAQLPAQAADFQYYVEAILPGKAAAALPTRGLGRAAGARVLKGDAGLSLVFPATGAQAPQTVMIVT